MSAWLQATMQMHPPGAHSSLNGLQGQNMAWSGLWEGEGRGGMYMSRPPPVSSFALVKVESWGSCPHFQGASSSFSVISGPLALGAPIPTGSYKEGHGVTTHTYSHSKLNQRRRLSIKVREPTSFIMGTKPV